MLEIYPKLSKVNCICPACGCQLSEATKLLFQGRHILADVICTCCDKEYYQTLPIEFGSVFPVSFTKDVTKVKYSTESKSWMAEPLISSMLSDELFEPEIDAIKNREFQKAIIFNCLDNNRAHVFQKLSNIQCHMINDGEYGLIIIAPIGFKRFIPEGVPEIWSINAPVEEFRKRISNLDKFVKSQYHRFDSIYLVK